MPERSFTHPNVAITLRWRDDLPKDVDIAFRELISPLFKALESFAVMMQDEAKPCQHRRPNPESVLPAGEAISGPGF